MDDVLLEVTGVAAGGDGLARDTDGRVVFVEGGLPGESVRARIIEAKKDHSRAAVTEVLRASADRVAPPCPAVARGCGGCGWLHVAAGAQGRLKREVVADALRRIAHMDDPPLAPDVLAAAPTDYRTTVTAAVDEHGRPSLHRHRSRDLVTVEGCLVAHPLVEEVLVEGRFAGASEVVVRASVASGQRIVLVRAPLPAPPAGQARRDRGRDSGRRAAGRPTAASLKARAAASRAAAAAARVPDGVVVVAEADARAGHPALSELVAGRWWRVSATSFFQSGPAAAGLLAAAVQAECPGADDLYEEGLVVDAYAGVGLLGGAVVVGTGRRLLAVEQHAVAAADAVHNLRDLDAQVVTSEVALLPPPPADAGISLVLADPARPGLGRSAAAALAALGAPRLVLVSCDPASMARDAGLLAGHGYTLAAATVLDLFPGTPHVEVVSRFEQERP